MKQKLIYTLSVAATLLATACTDDMGIQDISVDAGKGHLVHASAEMTPASRMAIEHEGEWVNYYWTSDDAFTVFDSRHAQQTVFSIVADSLGNQAAHADFTGTPETAYAEGQTLYAVYSKNGEIVTDNNGNVTLDLSGQNGRLNEKYQYMFGQGVYETGRDLEFHFRHLVTTLQVKFAVPEGVTSLSNVTLHSPYLVSRATLVLNKAPYDSENQFKVGDLVYPYSENGYTEYGDITLEGTFIPEDGYVTLYFYTLAAKQYYNNVTWNDESIITPAVLFNDQDGKQYVSTDYFAQKNIEVGSVYSMEINNMFKLENFANEYQVYGDDSHPYEIATVDQFYTMMLRSYHGLADRNGNYYYRRSYKLMDDMELDRRCVWYPVRLAYATFDGNGKTVSGDFLMHVIRYSGFFSQLEYTTVKDLTLDADITMYSPNTSEWFYWGGIAGYMVNRSKISRCFNNSRVVMGAEYNGSFGGIIGFLGYACQVEYCGYSGSVTSELNYASAVGGIAGENTSWSTGTPVQIIGCYSDGSFKLGTIYNRSGVGGIIGDLRGDPQAVIKYCWSNTSVSTVDEYNQWYWGGIVGQTSSSTQQFHSCYWNNALPWVGLECELEPVNSASFQGAIPTEEQLNELNLGIMSTGLMFSEENGRLVKNTHTVVPPSDIENW